MPNKLEKAIERAAAAYIVAVLRAEDVPAAAADLQAKLKAGGYSGSGIHYRGPGGAVAIRLEPRTPRLLRISKV